MTVVIPTKEDMLDNFKMNSLLYGYCERLSKSNTDVRAQILLPSTENFV